ncbi:carboxypeptidase-like regulatory domain-containing protein [Bizionia argentinensis JUB59]|uniref:Carboxypeptidase-like regulatory domain-containing protein n=1 Tax=Bizionia argentinensis JUB59 TaxID=1046627 RepID=G2EE52_9FLAO|nr:carboxypeptidase-like regulatory domain-containing protein [Bizionia argentinensis]EGV43275.1 carboxypeptidase-like regulatory domain-containing protein [Bizionia argentinensis JUB59]
MKSFQQIKQILYLLTVFGTYISGFSQVEAEVFIEISGKVVDSNTKNALVFADIIVSDSNIATVSNNEGNYILKIPANFKDRFIVVTYLGYAEKKVSIVSALENNVIKLQQTVTPLQEISIIQPKNAETLLRLMLQNIPDNYVESSMEMTGFYRETIKKRRQNVSLSEAVINIYKRPNSQNRRDAIELVKARKSTNYAKLDTLAFKLQGGPFSNLYTDIVKYPQYIFNEDNLKVYNYTFDESTVINDQLIYVVNFKQKPEYEMPLYYGKLYIDSKTYALISAVFSLNVENRELASELFVKQKPRKAKVYPTAANYRVNYRNSNGKWYYSYSSISLTFKVNWKGRLFNSVYTLNSEMAITNWNYTDERYSKTKNKEQVFRPNSILIDEASGFSDPEFWGEYNIIEPEKSIESAIEKIQKQLDKT